MENPHILFSPDILKKGVEVVNRTNEEVAEIIGINPAARTTCVKPSGNASVLLQTTSGIHSAHSTKYLRIMQMNKENEMAKIIENTNPLMLENSVWSATGNDYAVYIPIEETSDTLTKDNVSDINFLDFVKNVYENWIIPGTHRNRGYSDRVTHNVSNTISVQNWDGVFNYIYENQQSFCGLSFMAEMGDKVYKQAPFTKVMTFEELYSTFGEGIILASGLIVDALHAFDNDLWDACEASLNSSFKWSGDRYSILLKKDVVRRIKKFSKNYFKNNLELTVECLKNVHVYHKYNSIQKEFKNINFKEVDMKPSFTDVSSIAGVACSGGVCEITRI